MTIMFLTLALLHQYSNIRRGLIFYDETDEISNVASFAYNYIPTISGLALLVLWSFTTYDVFRLEPYFQLSKNQVFPADVLSANYIFGPFISTPISAARRQHWAVLGVSVVNILLQLLMPAMLSTLLEVEDVSISSHETLRSWPELVDVGEQVEWIHSQRNTSLDYPVMKGSGKTALRLAKYVVPPVDLPFDDTFTTASWKLNHTVYWTDLTCSELRVNSVSTANVTVSAINKLGSHSRMSWELQDFRVASTSGAFQNCTFHVNYSGFFDPTATTIQARHWELEAISCPSVDLYGFILDINATELSQMVGQTRSFSSQNQGFMPKIEFFSCDMGYYTAKAEVSVRTNGSVFAVDVDKRSTSELDSSRLDIPGLKTYFKRNICPSGNMCSVEDGASANSSLDQCGLLVEGYGHPCSSSAQASQAPISGEEFMSRTRIAMKAEFARLMSLLFDTNAKYTSITGVRATDQVAIVVVPLPAIASEIILFLGGTTCFFLALFYRSRENMLKEDPGSIAAMCSIVADLFNPACVQTLARYTSDQFSERLLNRKLRVWRCYWHYGPSGKRLGLMPGESSSGGRYETAMARIQARKRAPRPDRRPHFLSKPIFAAELLSLIVVVSAMAIIFVISSKDPRFRNLSDSASDRISLPLSVLPALIASMMRALFTSIYLNLSILEPWIHLQQGRADAKRSLLLNLSSQNPITVFWRSIRSRHIVLSLAALCCIINTGLPAVLGALFTQSRNESAWPTQDVKLRYNDSVVFESSLVPSLLQYDPIESTFLNGIQSLPWTTPDYSLIPLSVAANSLNYMYEAAALGIGAELDCQQISLSDVLSKVEKRGVPDIYSFAIRRGIEHTALFPALGSQNASESYSIQLLAPSKPKGETDYNKFIVLSNGNWSSKTGLHTHRQSLPALQCQPTVKLQNFSVGFNSNGFIRYYSPIGSAITSGPIMNNMTANLAKYQHQFVSSLQGSPANATLSDGPRMFLPDWPGSLIKLVYQKANPELTYIDPDGLATATELVYQWLFSTYFSLRRDVYLQHLTKPALVSNAKVMRNTWSIDRSLPSFIVALVMVSFMAFVLVLVFVTRQGQFKGPRIPRSLGSVLVWLVDSPVLASFHGTYRWSSADRRDYLIALDRRYTFRMITTPAGEHKWVIEEEPPEKAA
jgi:hypothetical protein